MTIPGIKESRTPNFTLQILIIINEIQPPNCGFSNFKLFENVSIYYGDWSKLRIIRYDIRLFERSVIICISQDM